MTGELHPTLRASDRDRDACADRLRTAHAEGRLTVEEFNERLDATFAARTLGELQTLTRDLPGPVAPAPVVPRTGDEARPARRPLQRGLRAAWAVWATAVGVNLAVWAAVSLSARDLVYFWPMWVAGPWGAVLLAGTVFGRHEQPGTRLERRRPSS